MRSIFQYQGEWSGTRRPPVVLLLPVVALVLALGWGMRSAGQRLEAEAGQTIRADLDAQGLSSIQLQISGRRAYLTGLVPAMGDGARALKVARSTMCESWFGATSCVKAVTADFGTLPPGIELWPELKGSVDRGVLRLEGEVSDQAIRDVALDVAREALGLGRLTEIVDEFRITNTTSPRGMQPLIKRIVKALSLCETGAATLSNGTTSLQCVVPRAAEEMVRELLASPLPAGSLGELRIVVVDPLTGRTPTVSPAFAR